MRDIIESLLFGFLATWTPIFEDVNTIERIGLTFALAIVVLSFLSYLEDRKRA